MSTVNCNNLSFMISIDFVQWTVIATTRYQVNHFIIQEHAMIGSTIFPSPEAT